MREHVKPSVRMHYVITQGGKVPNIVPDYAQLWCWVRDSQRAVTDPTTGRIVIASVRDPRPRTALPSPQVPRAVGRSSRR